MGIEVYIHDDGDFGKIGFLNYTYFKRNALKFFKSNTFIT